MSWEFYKLEDVCDVINGGSWTQDEYASQGVKVIKVSNLVNDGIDESNMSYLPYESTSVYEKNILKSYDLVVTTVGSHPQLKASAAGRGFVISPVYEGSLLNQNTVCIRTKDENILFNRYLGYVGRSDDFRHFIQQTGRGAANQMRIPISKIKTYALSLPKLETQKRIASILSNYDDLIENNLKRITLLEETAQNIYKEWFVNFRFPNYEHTEFDAESGLPKGWRKGKVADLCEVKSGYAFKSKDWQIEGNPVMKIKNITKNTVDITDCDYVDDEVAQSAEKFELFEGDVLIAMTGATVGKVGLIPKIDKRIYLNQRVGLFRPFSEIDNNVYLVFSFFMTDDAQKQILNFAGGAAQPNISSSQISEVELNIGSDEILKMFESKIQSIIVQIQTLYSQNQKLKEARDILLPRLMNRRIEV